ncbi:MAG: zf-HC2 domain-containing protein [Acidobacteria bacterium]|nr:zf-HC2 domain-containing protein [Acidobacteriota bacterium]
MQYIDNIDTRFQDLFAGFLRDRTNALSASASSSHLDEDTLAAFVDGGLTLREIDPIVVHLAECGHCRTSAAALLRLEAEFADIAMPARDTQVESPGFAEALSSWFSQLFGTSADGVFAHGERSEKDGDDDKNAGKDDDGRNDAE